MKENNILIPLRLEDRKIKQRQNTLRLLQQVIIDGDLNIDESFDFKKDQVKVKVVNGDIFIIISELPEWLENVDINGNVYFY